IELLSDWGGVVNSGPIGPGSLRLGDLYKLARRFAPRPLKVSVGAGPINLAWHVYFKHYKTARERSEALAPTFNGEGEELVAGGAPLLRHGEVRAGDPHAARGEDGLGWNVRVVRRCSEGVAGGRA